MSNTILIVEDDQRIASVVRFHLERESYSVHHAADGDTGLELALELKPDLVVLDVMLPGKSGYDVCREIRSSGGPQPAILMLTARVEEVDAVMGLTFGADDYVRKPFGVKELVARVRSLLQRARASGSGSRLPRGDLGARRPSRREGGRGRVRRHPSAHRAPANPHRPRSPRGPRAHGAHRAHAHGVRPPLLHGAEARSSVHA